MKTISRNLVNQYSQLINDVRSRAGTRLYDELDMYVMNYANARNSTAAKDALFAIKERIHEYALTYGDAAAEVACEFFDVVTELQELNAYLAEFPPNWYNPRGTNSAVDRAGRVYLESEDTEKMKRMLMNQLKYEVGLAAHKATSHNVVRNKKRVPGIAYARVPTGADTCAFCMLLASRGFVYTSMEAAEGLTPDHYHSDCDCVAVAGRGDSRAEGYDEEHYWDIYESGLEQKQKMVDDGDIKRWHDLSPEEKGLYKSPNDYETKMILKGMRQSHGLKH